MLASILYSTMGTKHRRKKKISDVLQDAKVCSDGFTEHKRQLFSHLTYRLGDWLAHKLTQACLTPR